MQEGVGILLRQSEVVHPIGVDQLVLVLLGGLAAVEVKLLGSLDLAGSNLLVLLTTLMY